MSTNQDTLNAVAIAEQGGDVVSLAKWCREGLAKEDALRERVVELRKCLSARIDDVTRLEAELATARAGLLVAYDETAAKPRQAAALRLAEAAQPFATLVDTSAAQVIALRAALAAFRAAPQPPEPVKRQLSDHAKEQAAAIVRAKAAGLAWWIEEGIVKSATPVDPEKFGGHDYGDSDHTSNCSYGCGCGMGPYQSWGHVDPNGPCPKNPRKAQPPEGGKCKRCHGQGWISVGKSGKPRPCPDCGSGETKKEKT